MPIESLASRLALVLALVTAGCQSATGTGDGSQWAGCYDNSCVSAPVAVPGVPALASLTTITYHTCGLTAAGEAWCWGDNSTGQLGDGTDQPRERAVRVASDVRFKRLTAGSGFTCGLALDGTAWCWGSAGTSQIGQPGPDRCMNGQVQCSKVPLALPGRAYTAIASGLRHTCAIDTAGAAWCWGFNFQGETGSSAYGETVTAPTRVAGSTVFADVGAGDSFTCALSAGQRAYCWGADGRGELGRSVPTCNNVAGFPNYCSPTPGPVNSTATFTSLSVGNSHVCGIATGGSTLCWGDNGQGQLGTHDYLNAMAPVVAQGGMAFSAISASGAVTCGTPGTGSSVCWGLNLFGKLGTGTRIEMSDTPLAIAGGRRFTSFAGGQYHVCALTADGAAWCWGSGRQGQLGIGMLLP